MPFLAIGVEHTTAPLPVRERVALDAKDIARISTDLTSSACIDEAAILSTCNRTEIYLFCHEDEVERATEIAVTCLVRGDASLREYIRTWEDFSVPDHLFRVASGLESQILGEPQIMSQVADALHIGQDAGTIATNLHSLFRSAISCARQARAGTALGKINVSLGNEAVCSAESILGTLEGRSVLIIGGGEISRMVAEELRTRRLHAMFIANRTASVAVDLANTYGGRAALVSDIPRLIPHVDVVISATSAQHYILTPEDIPADALAGRETPLHVFDLAMPRDVDPAVGSMPGIAVHDLDHLLPAGVLNHWDHDIQTMEGIIAAEAQEFMAWYLSRRVVPVIASLRSHVEAVSQQELKRVAPQLSDLTDRERAAVESLTQRLIDKMFHHLVMRLRLAAQTDPKLVDAAEFFFLHGEGSLFEHAHQAEREHELQQ